MSVDDVPWVSRAVKRKIPYLTEETFEKNKYTNIREEDYEQRGDATLPLVGGEKILFKNSS